MTNGSIGFSVMYLVGEFIGRYSQDVQRCLVMQAMVLILSHQLKISPENGSFEEMSFIVFSSNMALQCGCLYRKEYPQTL